MKLLFTPRPAQDIADCVKQHNGRRLARTGGDPGIPQHIILFPQVGRMEKPEGVRKLVTRRYAYLVYYSADEAAGEIIVLSIQHPARDRESEDA